MKKIDILQAPYVKEMIETTSNLYRLGWDERNGGNISYLLKEEEITPFLDPEKVIRRISMIFDASRLAGCYFIVTGSGRYFKNVASEPAENLGIVRVAEDGKTLELLWGLENECLPTSELPSHFMSHIARLEVDPDNRIVMHCHASHLLAMSFTHELDERSFSRTLWQMCTECLVVFPEGISIIPWMVPGTNEIGEATAEKMKETRLVLWPQHGIYGSGKDMDEVFGLIETAEKAAEVYTYVKAQGPILQTITDENLWHLADAFGVTPIWRKFIRKQVSDMVKKAFCMKVYPEKQEEYKKRHDELWPEMRTALREHGVIDYSIYLDPSTSLLFGYLVIEDEKLWEKMANTSINQKWWKYMEDIMETNPDASPVSWELMPVFEL